MSTADTEHLVDLLSSVGTCRVRRMFGGVGFFLGGSMFALVARDVFYLKTDDETRERFVAAGGECFAFDRGPKRLETSYYTPPDAALEDEDTMRPWAKLAVDAARRAAQAKAPKPPQRPKAKAPKPPAAEKRSTKSR